MVADSADEVCSPETAAAALILAQAKKVLRSFRITLRFYSILGKNGEQPSTPGKICGVSARSIGEPSYSGVGLLGSGMLVATGIPATHGRYAYAITGDRDDKEALPSANRLKVVRSLQQSATKLRKAGT